MCTTQNIMTEALNGRYLGLPTNMYLDKIDYFQYLIDRIIMKISGWKEKILSVGAKKIHRRIPLTKTSYSSGNQYTTKT